MISVIIVTYNREKYIKYAIESVLNQNYRNYELIIIDDGSTDSTKKIVKSYGKKINKYIFINHKGCSIARNTGIENANGKYIVWVDSDDMLLPSTLKIEKDEFLKNPLLDIVYGNYYIIDEEGIVKSYLKHEGYDNKEKLIASLVLKNTIPNPGTMIKKECFEKYGNFDPAFPRSHDYDLWVRMSKYCYFKYIDVYLYMWRMHKDSMSWGEKSRSYAQDDAEVLRRMLNIFTLKELFPTIDWNNLPEDVGKALAYNNIANIFTTRNAFKDAIEYYKKSVKEIPNEKALFNMGIIYFKMDEIKQGEKYIKEARRLNPNLFLNQENIKTIQGLGEKIQDAILEKMN